MTMSPRVDNEYTTLSSWLIFNLLTLTHRMYQNVSVWQLDMSHLDDSLVSIVIICKYCNCVIMSDILCE